MCFLLLYSIETWAGRCGRAHSGRSPEHTWTGRLWTESSAQHHVFWGWVPFVRKHGGRLASLCRETCLLLPLLGRWCQLHVCDAARLLHIRHNVEYLTLSAEHFHVGTGRGLAVPPHFMVGHYISPGSRWPRLALLKFRSFAWCLMHSCHSCAGLRSPRLELSTWYTAAAWHLLPITCAGSPPQVASVALAHPAPGQADVSVL